MKKSQVIWIAAASALFILLIVYLFSLSPKKYDWRESYYINDNEPFCTSVLVDLLEDYSPESEFHVMKSSPDKFFDTSSTGNQNYLYVSNFFHMQDSSMVKFLNFIDRGNTAFIAVNSFSEETTKTLFKSTTEDAAENPYSADDSTDHLTEIENDSTEVYITVPEPDIFQNSRVMNVNLNFTSRDYASMNGYPYTYEEKEIAYAYDWHSFNEAYVKSEVDAGTEALGRISSGGYNFISLQYGKGRIYIFTTPVVLTNYYLIQKENLEYTSKLFSYLSSGDILWDEYSKQSHGEGYSAPESQGPLQFILSQKSLRWAWYTMIAGLVLFIAFRSKRTQQIIPITEPNINKSLEFVQTIGRMYYMRNDQKKLAQQKMRLFLYFLKDRYKISNPETGTAFYATLAMKSQVPEEQIQLIFETYHEYESKAQMTDKELLHFHEILNTFYKNCK